jgi:hypothetical protein
MRAYLLFGTTVFPMYVGFGESKLSRVVYAYNRGTPLRMRTCIYVQGLFFLTCSVLGTIDIAKSLNYH